MLSFRKILVPTDFSEQSAAAYEHAQEIARHFDAKVDFIHVIPTLKYFNESLTKLGVPLDMEDDIYPHAQQDSKAKIKRAMEEHLREEQRGEAVVKVGRKPSNAIVEYARSERYDMIVMSARGEHESDLLRGGVTEKVIRRSEVPVFTVDKRLASGGLKRILVPTDASSLSFTCFPVALTLADIYDAEITLFHVVELHGSKIESGSWDHNKSEAENIYENLMRTLQEYLADYKVGQIAINRADTMFEDQLLISDGSSSKTIPLHTVIERGVTAHSVTEEYATEHADVVVITTHGRSGLAHFLLGSTTEKIAQYVDLPVLTVKPGKEKLKART